MLLKPIINQCQYAQDQPAVTPSRKPRPERATELYPICNLAALTGRKFV